MKKLPLIYPLFLLCGWAFLLPSVNAATPTPSSTVAEKTACLERRRLRRVRHRIRRRLRIRITRLRARLRQVRARQRRLHARR